uniref:RNA-directed DNA polymerase n=1 Tax=Trichogramma kaykai TaxID=54128 RepID=A0ABD2WDP4_9HYME
MSENECYPLPLTVVILERLASAKYISCIDLRNGFHQIAMDENSAHKTGFAGPNGIYEFKRLAMGIKSGPAVFSRAMSLALAGLQGTELEIYLDDVMVHGETLEEHNVQFKRMLDRFKAVNMSIEPKKCQMLKKDAHILGYIVGHAKIRMDRTKIAAMSDFPIPTERKKLKQFLGLTGYYRKFIKNYASIVRPLQQLLKKTVKYEWGEAQCHAFAEIKQRMCEYPVLRNPDLSQDFILTCDASEFAISAILGQGKIGSDHDCAYASRCLTGAELRYPTYDKELLAIVFGKEQFYYYLWGCKFTVYTDHQALVHFHNTKKPDLRFNRLKAELRGYDFDIVYRRGLTNANADALSRSPVINSVENPAKMSKQQLYQLADEQEQNDNKLPEELDYPPGRIFKIRTRRYRQAKHAQDKEKFDNESSSDSDDSLLPAAKFGAVEEISDDNKSDVSTPPLPERAAKARARKKISEIENAGRRQRKSAIPPPAPVIQIENLDLQQIECLGVQNDLISFQEDPGDPTPAAPIAQSSIENEDLPPNGVRESTYDPNEQQYVRRSFPEIAREISAKLRVDLRENPAPNRHGLQIDIWEVGSNDERPREVDKQNIGHSTSANDSVWVQSIEQSKKGRINNDTRFTENFDEFADATKECRDTNNHGANLGMRRMVGYSEHDGCAEPHNTLVRLDDIPDEPPGNYLFYSILKILKSDLTAGELRQCLLRSPFVDTCDDPQGVREILQSPSEWGNIHCLYIFAHSFKINVCIHFEVEPQRYIYPRFIVNNRARYIHLHLSKKHYTPYIPVAIATLHSANDNDSYKQAQDIGNSIPGALAKRGRDNSSQAKSADRHATGIIESPEQNRCAATKPAVALSTPTHSFTLHEDRLGPRKMHDMRGIQQEQSAQHCTLDYDVQMNDNTELLVPSYEHNSDNVSMHVESAIMNLPDESPPQEIKDARDHNTPACDIGGSSRQNANAAQAAKEGDEEQQGHTNAALCKY